MDMVLLNPWFSTQDTVSDTSILERYDLGNNWERDEEGGFRNTGNLSTGGVRRGSVHRTRPAVGEARHRPSGHPAA